MSIYSTLYDPKDVEEDGPVWKLIALISIYVGTISLLIGHTV